MMNAAMLWRRLLPLLLTAVALAGDDPERVPGRVTLSDGTVLEGPVRTTTGKPLRLVEEGTGRRLDLSLAEILRIRVHVTHEEEYRVWRWVEDGSREKVYTGESYPKREYQTEVVLRNGQVHLGDMVAVLYVYVEGAAKPEKVILRKKDQGEVGETLADLGHVDSVELDGGTVSPGALSGLRLVVVPGDGLLAAHAMPRERDRAVQGVPGQGGDSVLFHGLLPGAYDLVVVTEEKIFLSLGVGEDGGEPLDEETLAEVRSRVAEIADFFEDREALLGVRSGDRLRVVVRKSREGPTSMGGKRTFRRFELWAMHRGGDRWLVDHRSFLWRDHGEGLRPPQEVVPTDALGPIEVSAGAAEVRFRVPGEEDR